MSRSASSGSRHAVVATLRALGGQATLGDIVAITGVPRVEVEESLLALMATDRGHVRVSESGIVVYHIGKNRRLSTTASSRADGQTGLSARLSDCVASLRRGLGRGARNGRVVFDRKTLRLIRAREGVISLAELVEHTGLPLAEAEDEMARLAESYGGESHPSWDGHVVCAFPGLMTSAQGDFPVREPRPAWVRADDPMRRSGGSRRRETVGLLFDIGGLVSSVVLPWLVSAELGLTSPATIIALVLVPSATGTFLFGRRLMRGIRAHRFFRFRRPRTLRRYALGYVFETALKGKGVVSLDRTVAYLQARAGHHKVKRSAVEQALRQLADEFEAPVTDHNGDYFFGFRNVKRQFLASHVQRQQLQLARKADGRTVFDSADSPLEAAARDLARFDRELGGPPSSRAPVPPSSALP